VNLYLCCWLANNHYSLTHSIGASDVNANAKEHAMWCSYKVIERISGWIGQSRYSLEIYCVQMHLYTRSWKMSWYKWRQLLLLDSSWTKITDLSVKKNVERSCSHLGLNTKGLSLVWPGTSTSPFTSLVITQKIYTVNVGQWNSSLPTVTQTVVTITVLCTIKQHHSTLRNN